MTLKAQTVKVDLGDRSYDIVIGRRLITDLDAQLSPVLGLGRVHIVSDENVFKRHGSELKSLNRPFSQTILPAGESQKSFDVLQKLLDDMFTHGLDRQDTLIAFGGGVIGDLTGFAASIFKRGCQFIQIPTTLLAQVDSSVGGKTAINVAQGKNLVGAFYQPSKVISDVEVLETLPERELKAGYAEILKYGLLGSRAFFDWLQINGPDVLALKAEAVKQAVATSCKMKADIVAQDERERGQRALLNLGHTFGHALEAEAGYSSDLLHGEAVSAGMQMAFEYSAQEGLCAAEDAGAVKDHLDRTGLTQIRDVARYLKPEHLMAHMGQDKKNEMGALTLILARSIGEAFVQKSAPQDRVRAYLESLI